VAELDDPEALRAIVEPGSCVVFAAGPSVPAAVEREPLADTALLGPLEAATEAVRRAPGAFMLFLSSGGAVYGEPELLPIPEDHPLRPRSAYGAAKVVAETCLGYAARRHGVPVTALRCGNAYGPGQTARRGQGLIVELLAAAESGRPVPIWGDGSITRDFVHLDDITAAITALAAVGEHRRLPLALNVGSGHGTSVADTIAIVRDVIGRPVPLERRPERAFDAHHIALDISQLRSLIDFAPLSLHDGVRSMWSERAADTVA
jgi:UDP-glucose 4-epimerase